MGSIIAGISLTCFAASYAVAWALELAKLAVQSRAQRFLMMAFVVAGWFAHTLYLGYRVVEYSASPLSSSFDWCLVAAWLLIGAFLYLSYYFPRAALGLYMLPLALALVAAATFADRTPFAPEPASRVWGAVHGISLLIGTLAVMVGFVAGVMYLVQASRLKRKLPPSPGFRLPSLEWLEKVNSRVIILSTLMVGIGFLAGIILNVVGRDQPSAIPWSDPVIWTSGLMLAWLSAATIFNAFYRPARRGRKVAYLTVVSFVFLVVVLAVFLLVSNEHGGQDRRADSGEAGTIQAATGLSAASQFRRHDNLALSPNASHEHFGPGGRR
jgi:ABC-type transport system involved in cytochrome c biogenesis permease subunit